jgi:uncharacterized tellurite resistance protein B-like protein
MTSIREFLGLGSRPAGARAPSAETETVRRIIEALDRLPPDRARHLAAFAYILGRVANADLEISRTEIRAMERLVMENGGLPEEQAAIVVQMAKTQSLLFGATENFLVTREFSRIATREEKINLLTCLFAVSASDDFISVVEDNEIRRISKELGLEHKDFIAARLPFREALGVLKTAPEREPGE